MRLQQPILMACAVLTASLAASPALACVSKTGKTCTTIVKTKVDKNVKYGQPSIAPAAPAGNVGSVVLPTGVNSLGIPLAQYVDQAGYQLNGITLTALDALKLRLDRTMTQTNGQLTPDAIAKGYTQIVMPALRPLAPHLLVAPPPYQYFLTRNGQTVPLTPNQVAALRRSGFVRGDGSLKPESEARGFSAVAPYPVPTPQEIRVPQLALKAPAAQGATSQQAEAQPTALGEPEAGSTYRYQDTLGAEQHDIRFVVIGFKEPAP